MALYLFLGGISSGKSERAENFALNLCKQKGVQKLHLCVYGDEHTQDFDFMRKIKAHQQRRSQAFITHNCFYEPLESLHLIPDEGVLMLDDLGSAYVSFMRFEAQKKLEAWQEFLEFLSQRQADTVIVSPESGLSLVSAYEAGKEFQEAVGLANQFLAHCATEMYLVVAARLIPLHEA